MIPMRSAVVAGLASLALAGCFGDEASGDVTMVEEIAVEAGYTVPRPEGFEAAQFGEELRLTEAGDLRAPRDIRVTPAEAGAALPGEAETRGDVTYAIVDAGAGSAGTFYEMTALKPVGSAAVRVVASVQTEASPDFGWVWPVIDGITTTAE